MSFKDQVARDIDQVFFNTNEFSDNVTIDGVAKVVQIDEDALKERANNEYGGVTTGLILYFIPVSAFGPNRPMIGAQQIFNNRLMWIEDVKEAAGVYEITLNQNRGE